MEVNIKFFEIILGAFIMVVDNDKINRNAIQIFDMKGKLKIIFETRYQWKCRR